MTTISKVLVVFTAAACIAFMAFVIVTAAGGPNWETEARQIPGYYLEQTSGENPQWVVKSRLTGEQVAQGMASQPQAIVSARRKIRDDQKSEITQLDADLEQVKAELAEAKALIEVDVEAIEKREAELEAELADLRQQIQAAANEGIQKAQQAQAVQAEAVRRREDVYRLENQLEEIRTDKFRAQAQADKLRDQLVLLEGNLERLHRRNDQLKQRVSPETYDEGTPESVPADAGQPAATPTTP
jgi:chaperonin cofactor prefoldin